MMPVSPAVVYVPVAAYVVISPAVCHVVSCIACSPADVAAAAVDVIVACCAMMPVFMSWW